MDETSVTGVEAGLGTPTAAAQTWTGHDAGKPLAGKVAVITGAARGIGRAIAVDFARNGADIVGVDLCKAASPIIEYTPTVPADLDATGDLVKSIGRRWIGMTADIRNIGELREIASMTEREFGRIDIVVANAAIQAFKPILEMEDENWLDVIDNNLNGSANTLRAFAPSLVKNGKGRFIFISSMQGRYGMKHGASYAASKWGIIGLMKSAALELGKHKITVNSIEPGLIDTPLTRNARRWSEAVGETMTTPPPEQPTEEETIKARLPKVPLQVPWIAPEKVAPVATFLASDAAEMVTGACYDVNAGDSAHDLG
jgi:NAD(P)-dependent dehydrogenase (short-subunit alcohol dehydrogenase family)